MPETGVSQNPNLNRLLRKLGVSHKGFWSFLNTAKKFFDHLNLQFRFLVPAATENLFKKFIIFIPIPIIGIAKFAGFGIGSVLVLKMSVSDRYR